MAEDIKSKFRAMNPDGYNLQELQVIQEDGSTKTNQELLAERTQKKNSISVIEILIFPFLVIIGVYATQDGFTFLQVSGIIIVLGFVLGITIRIIKLMISGERSESKE